MPDLYFDVDAAISEAPVNLLPLLDDTDGKTIETCTYNQAGLALKWNFVTCAGAFSQTAVTPTDTGGNYDWVSQGNGMFTIEIPASGGASINNDTEGFGWFTGVATGILPWRGPVIGFRRAALNDLLIDGSTASTNLEDFFDGTGYAGGTAKLGVDAVAISGDTTAADNLEAQFDGTGYAGGTVRQKVDVDTIKTQAVTCGAGVTINPYVGLSAASGANLEKSASVITRGTVDETAFTMTTTEFEADDITTAAADHWNGRIIIFTSGTLLGQATDITDYSKVGSNGHFTVTALTSAPANDVSFVIV